MLCSDLFLLPLSHNDDDSATSLASSAAHPLDQSDGTLVGIETYNEVHLPNVQSLLPHTGGHQSIVASVSKPPHHLQKVVIVTHIKISNVFHKCYKLKIEENTRSTVKKFIDSIFLVYKI